ncbi:MAG: undecaprenyl-diphosphate phosphatase [Clostridia bacterium]|nr:undecaprenyl-diphosphate phosphatase [Clostridia bacterium]
MQYIQSIILGLVQGLTEFLPVSSSGHLAIFKHIFGEGFFTSGITFDIMLHIGTLIAVFAVYYKDIWELILEFFRLIGDIFRGRFEIKTPYRRMLLMLIVASIPAAVFGMLVKDFIESISEDRLWVVGICLFITAFLLFISDKISKGTKEAQDLTVGSSLVVGLFQAFAVLPGISRSGSTIVGGLFNGFSREFAVKFSFLLSIPAILGAALLDFKDVLSTGFDMSPLAALLGVVVAAASGFWAIKVLLKVVKNGKFRFFAYYCALAGVVTLIISFI